MSNYYEDDRFEHNLRLMKEEETLWKRKDMIHDTHEFYFEDFVNDISKYLKQHEKEFIVYSVDPCTALAQVDINKLAVKLAQFWQESFIYE